MILNIIKQQTIMIARSKEMSMIRAYFKKKPAIKYIMNTLLS